MSIEFIGMIATQHRSEIHPAQGPVIDPGTIINLAKAHEDAGFDRVLVAHHSSDPDGVLVASYAAAHTTRLGFMIAHRPGFVAPAYAARQFATFDVLSGGRAGIHIITGGNDAEQRQDGDFLGHAERYQRTDEFLTVLRRTWSSTEPFDFEGKYYKFERAFSRVKPVQTPHPPIYFGGSSDIAIEVAGRHADVYAFWGETLEQARETIARVRASAARAGRDPQAIRFSLSLRPIIADTEEAAWKRANDILDRIRALRGDAAGKQTPKPQSAGSQRLLQAAAGGPVRDKRLWTEVAAAVGAGANTTGLVGTPEQVVDSLLDYHALGVSTFLIRGFDPLQDAIEYGRDLLPLARDRAARRERQPVAAE
jgi:alkanesulfonate monooxygenase